MTKGRDMHDTLADNLFDEFVYLQIHKDVKEAVRDGLFASGREHFEKHGQSEGRVTDRFATRERVHFLEDYTRLVDRLIQEYPDDLPLAMAKAIGSLTVADFDRFGKLQAALLRKHGLTDGMSLYDLACGSGRTASGLRQSGWVGNYVGADIIEPLVEFASKNNPGYDFHVHRDFSIRAADSSVHMIFAWSLFTHLNPEEAYLYIADGFRALNPGGRFIFTFLEVENASHWTLFKERVAQISHGEKWDHLDYFFNRSFIKKICEDVGYELVGFVDGDDQEATPMGCLWQSLAVMRKPSSADETIR